MPFYRIMSVDVTREYYGVGSEMKDQIGNVLELSSPTETNVSFRYKGYTWRYEDVKEVDLKPHYPDPELFDPSNIMEG